MELANIKTKKVYSLLDTLRAMPIGREQVIPSRIFPTDNVRKAASKLRSEGYSFSVSSRGILDTCVTRLQ